MSPIRKRDLQRCLESKFDFQQVAGSKHEAMALYVDGKKVATTRFSRSHREISDSVLRQIAKQIWVQLGYLREMFQCTKSSEEYLTHLGDTNHLD